jgi:predicted nuclease with TOPRIM domain
MRKSYQELQEGVTLDGQLSKLRKRFDELEDHRAANNSYSLSDILMSGYAMFSLKYPSLLQFETQTQVEQQNLHQL